MKHVLLLCTLCLSLGAPAFAEAPEQKPEVVTTAAPTQSAAPSKVKIGSEVTKLETLGERSARTGIFVLGVLLIGLSIAKRWPKKDGITTDQIKLLSRKQIAPGSSLLVVQVENRRLLLGQTADSLSMLTDLTPSVQERTFAQILSEVEDDEVKLAVHN